MFNKKKRTAEEKLHYRLPVELWSDRWNHTGAMIRTVVGIVGLAVMFIMWYKQ